MPLNVNNDTARLLDLLLSAKNDLIKAPPYSGQTTLLMEIQTELLRYGWTDKGFEPVPFVPLRVILQSKPKNNQN